MLSGLYCYPRTKGWLVSSQMLTMAEAAEFTGIKFRTWQSYYRIWEVPHYRIGKNVLFSPDDLGMWLDTKRVAA